MGYAVVLIAPWNIQVYPLYSIADQTILGWSLILTGWLFIVGVAYIVRKNPSWLQGFGGSGGNQVQGGPSRSRGTFRGRTAAVASVSLILVLAVYFAATGAAVASATNSSRVGVAVYIAETPVSWQYSPQDVVVVIGVNNTVTWVSHSTAYDTITSDTGLFDSGPIQPGGTFSHTFSAPGVYSYHCVFHPWMVGRVTVLQGRSNG